MHARATFREIKKSLVHDPGFERSSWVGTAIPSRARRRRIRHGLAVAALLVAILLIMAESYGAAVSFLGAAIAFGLDDRTPARHSRVPDERGRQSFPASEPTTELAARTRPDKSDDRAQEQT